MLLKTKLISLFGIVALGLPVATLAANKADANKPRLLFVMTAAQGAIKPVAERQYEVTLSKVNPRVIQFTDAPLKQASRIDTMAFLKFWEKNKAKLQPNVAVEGLVLQNGQLLEHNYIMTLTNPQYNQQLKTLTYQGKLLGNEKLAKLAQLSDITLFIDDIPGGGSWIP